MKKDGAIKYITTTVAKLMIIIFQNFLKFFITPEKRINIANSNKWVREKWTKSEKTINNEESVLCLLDIFISFEKKIIKYNPIAGRIDPVPICCLNSFSDNVLTFDMFVITCNRSIIE